MHEYYCAGLDRHNSTHAPTSLRVPPGTLRDCFTLRCAEGEVQCFRQHSKVDEYADLCINGNPV